SPVAAGVSTSSVNGAAHAIHAPPRSSIIGLSAAVSPPRTRVTRVPSGVRFTSTGARCDTTSNRCGAGMMREEVDYARERINASTRATAPRLHPRRELLDRVDEPRMGNEADVDPGDEPA